MRIPVTLTGKVKVTVSNDGRCFCLAAATENQVWQLYHDEDQFEQLPTNLPASAVEAGWTFFSPSGQHLYVVGNDASATVEIFSLANRRIERLLRKPLVEKATIYFPIHDVVLLPDETALIVQFRNQPCFEYRIAWSSDGTPSFKQLGINAPQLKPFKIDGITQSMNQPKKLFIDANSQRLGMTFSDTVLFLHRVPDAPADKFSFAIPGESPAGCEMLKATYEVMDVQFSKDRQRIATRHDDGSVELWDFDGKDYTAFKSDGLFEHRPQNGRFSAGLRGHLKEVGALSFANGDADRLLTVSADQSIRTWQISTYQALALQMQRIRDLFELEPSLPPDGIPERNTE